MDLLEPTAGVVERDRGARIALVNQHHADQINLDLVLNLLALLVQKYEY